MFLLGLSTNTIQCHDLAVVEVLIYFYLIPIQISMLYCFASEHYVEKKINRLSLFTFFCFCFCFVLYVCLFLLPLFFLILAKNTFVEGYVAN